MNTVNLTKGPIGRQLFSLAAPLAVAIAANMSFNLIDTYFVGQLGIEQLTAISFSFPVVIVLLNLAIGIGIGVSSVLSRLIGKGDQELVRELGFICALVTLVSALILAAVGVYTIGPLFSQLGAKPKHLPYIEDYMRFAYFAMAFRMISIAVSGSFRSHGKTMVPSAAIVTLAVLNTILDPLLIFGIGPFPKLGIAGAGMATFIANFVGLAIELYVAFFRYRILSPSLKITKEKFKHLVEVTKIGFPSAIGNALNPLSISLGNFFLAKEATEAVAGLGIGSKVMLFSMIPALALSAGLGPMVGQNFGKGEKARLLSAMKMAFKFCALLAVVQFLVLYFGGAFFSKFFSQNQAAVNYSAKYLELTSFTLAGYSFVIMASSMLNAIGQPIKGFWIIFLRTILLFLGFYYLFVFFNLEYSVILAYAASNVFAASAAYWEVFKHETRNLFSSSARLLRDFFRRL